eukprot:3586195-Lingulodinium_polyedra.AAC.1
MVGDASGRGGSKDAMGKGGRRLMLEFGFGWQGRNPRNRRGGGSYLLSRAEKACQVLAGKLHPFLKLSSAQIAAINDNKYSVAKTRREG